jgi:hypothetical protein
MFDLFVFYIETGRSIGNVLGNDADGGISLKFSVVELI